MNTGAATVTMNVCWNKIGVWGDASCPELRKHIHCRNCPVYHAAAATLLNREPPPGYLEDWTARLAQPRQPGRVGTKSVVIFRVGGEWLALPATRFQEVAELRPIHMLPHGEGKMSRGLVNIRGELLVCISLSELLGLEMAPEPKEETPGTIHRRLLVLAHKSGRIVFPVNEVHSGWRYHPDELQPVPATVSLAATRYSVGLLAWQDHHVGVLDEELLFFTMNRSLG